MKLDSIYEKLGELEDKMVMVARNMTMLYIISLTILLGMLLVLR